MDENLHYYLSWNAGRGTNSLAEAKALAGLLAFCSFFDIHPISIFRDSKSMVDHVNGISHILCLHLTCWLDKIMFYWNQMAGSTIHHVHREKNQMADVLSKEGLLHRTGSWSLMVYADGESHSIQDFCIPCF